MREDLRSILRGETISNFIQPDSRQTFPVNQIPPTQKSAPFSANDFQNENETIVRSVPSFGQTENRRNSSVWIYATLALVLVGVIGLGVYFLSNQPKQASSSKNEVAQVSSTQPNINSTNFENVNATVVANSSIVTSTPTPLPTATPEKVKNTKVKVRIVELSPTECSFKIGKIFLRRANGIRYKLQGVEFDSYSAYVEKNGFAIFNDIPCGEEIIIEGGGEVGIRQNINCSKSVYLGSFDINSGRKISEREANACLPY